MRPYSRLDERFNIARPLGVGLGWLTPTGSPSREAGSELPANPCATREARGPEDRHYGLSHVDAPGDDERHEEEEREAQDEPSESHSQHKSDNAAEYEGDGRPIDEREQVVHIRSIDDLQGHL